MLALGIQQHRLLQALKALKVTKQRRSDQAQQHPSDSGQLNARLARCRQIFPIALPAAGTFAAESANADVAHWVDEGKLLRSNESKSCGPEDLMGMKIAVGDNFRTSFFFSQYTCQS